MLTPEGWAQRDETIVRPSRPAYSPAMNPNNKLLIAGVILLVALAFYFLGEGLLNTAEAPTGGAIMPRGLLGALNG
jgi:hypothetical protein